MAYLGIFLILVAAGLRLAGGHLAGPSREPWVTSSFRGVHAVPLGAAAFLVAASGVFIFAVGISVDG